MITYCKCFLHRFGLSGTTGTPSLLTPHNSQRPRNVISGSYAANFVLHRLFHLAAWQGLGYRLAYR